MPPSERAAGGLAIILLVQSWRLLVAVPAALRPMAPARRLPAAIPALRGRVPPRTRHHPRVHPRLHPWIHRCRTAIGIFGPALLLRGILLAGLSGHLSCVGVVPLPVLVLGFRRCRMGQSDRSNRRRERGHTKDITHVITCWSSVIT